MTACQRKFASGSPKNFASKSPGHSPASGAASFEENVTSAPHMVTMQGRPHRFATLCSRRQQSHCASRNPGRMHSGLHDLYGSQSGASRANIHAEVIKKAILLRRACTVQSFV